MTPSLPIRAAEPLEPPAILAVDDVEANLTTLRAVLEDLPCHIVTVSSGTQALRALLRRQFAVMLLDVQMPEMDGYEVARHARMNPATRDVPIIFLTATHDSPETVARGYGSGAVDFLFKPIDSTILRSKVRIFLELFENRRELSEKNRDLERAYRELQAAQAQLVQAAKMASLGQLVAGISHEINNPLAFVISHCETVRRSLERFRQEAAVEVPERAEQQWQRAGQRLTEIQEGLTRIRDLGQKLRTFSRLDEGERKTVNVAECVESVLTILRHRLGDGISVAVDARPPAELDCYPGLLNQALLNLVANSIDAMKGQGRITLSCGGDESGYVISVADTGPGIPLELRERVLEPFFTTKAVGEGTGLGLSITYSIVKKHAGTLTLGDAPGGGALTTLRLPLSPPG